MTRTYPLLLTKYEMRILYNTIQVFVGDNQYIHDEYKKALDKILLKLREKEL